MKPGTRLALILLPLVAAAVGFSLWTHGRDHSEERPSAQATPDVAVASSNEQLGRPTGLDEDLTTGERASATAPDVSKEKPDLPEPVVASGIEIKLVCRRIAGSNPGAPVAGVELTYQLSSALKPVPAGQTDASGTLHVSLSKAGEYLFGVEPATLPEGLQAPGDYDVDRGVELRGITSPEYHVIDAAGQEFTLWLHDARTIHGSVVGPDGEPLADVPIELFATDHGMQRVHQLARTDLLGAFEFPGVFPVEYLLRIQSLGSDAERLAGCVIPPPLFLDGDDLPAAPFLLEVGRGDLTLVGRVENEVGEPMPGIQIHCFYRKPSGLDRDSREAQHRYSFNDYVALLLTGDDGTFTLQGVRRHPLGILAGANVAGWSRGGEHRLVRGSKVIRFDPTSLVAGTHDVGTVVLNRSHTFVISGRVEVTAGRFNGRALPLSSVGLRGEFDEAERERLSLVQGRETQHEPIVEYDSGTGLFAVYCDTPCEKMTLTLLVGGLAEKQFEFFPTPNGTESDVVLQFP